MPTPTPAAPAADDPVAKLTKAKQMLDAGLITQAQYESEIEKMHADIENAQLRYEYETAARLRYSELPALERKLEEAEKLKAELEQDEAWINRVDSI